MSRHATLSGFPENDPILRQNIVDLWTAIEETARAKRITVGKLTDIIETDAAESVGKALFSYMRDVFAHLRKTPGIGEVTPEMMRLDMQAVNMVSSLVNRELREHEELYGRARPRGR